MSCSRGPGLPLLGALGTVGPRSVFDEDAVTETAAVSGEETYSPDRCRELSSIPAVHCFQWLEALGSQQGGWLSLCSSKRDLCIVFLEPSLPMQKAYPPSLPSSFQSPKKCFFLSLSPTFLGAGGWRETPAPGWAAIWPQVLLFDS